ncbi:MAG: HAMP domain-containing protein, partial [Polaromonas sp.]|nr:HAMP domain-containing protein [Gemmatimonadaceae bacterium]
MRLIAAVWPLYSPSLPALPSLRTAPQFSVRLKMAAIAGASVLLTLGIVVLPTFASLSAEIPPDQARQLATQVAVYAALAVAAATVIAWIGAGRFARGMVELTQQSDRVAQGMLRQDLLYESDDEVGQLADSFREMTRGLRTVVSQLDAGASDVA